MRLITMNRGFGEVRLEFYGCPLTCKFCAHRISEKKDFTYDQVLTFCNQFEIKKIFIGGAEPALQKKELLGLIKTLKKRGKEVTLKTTGHDPAFIKDTIGSVHRYVVEVKCALDDLQCMARLTNASKEKAREHLDNLKSTLEGLRGQLVRIHVRVIPPYINLDSIQKIGQQVQGIADEALLVQFLSSINDLPFEGIERPAPPTAEVESMGNALLKYIPTVRLEGEGLSLVLRA